MKDTNVPPSFWERFDEQLQEATRAALGYFKEEIAHKPTPAATKSMFDFDVLLPLLLEIGERHGWKPHAWSRNPASRTTRLTVQATCGHRSHFTLDDDDMMFACAVGPVKLVGFLWLQLGQEAVTNCKCGVPALPGDPE